LYRFSEELEQTFVYTDLDHGYQSFTSTKNASESYVYTFGDLLDKAVSYRLMGVENDLAGAKAKLTSGNTGWSFYFDLSHLICRSYFNGSHNLYIPYDVFKIAINLEYNNEGILSHFSLSEDFSFENPLISKTFHQTYDYWLGGNPSKSTSLPYYLFIPIALSVLVVIKAFKKKTIH